jgi:3'(2'), 5'-bisphosphate nucleotidase
MLTLNSLETRFALDVVRQASQLVRQVQAEMASHTLTKGDRSPVTVADFASQAVVAHLLSYAFPKDPLVAEEDAQALRDPAQQATLEQVTGFVARCIPKAEPQAVCDWIDRGADQSSQRFWTLDPIDGTKGFLRGEQYAVALALVVDGRVELGVLGCPNLSAGYRQQFGGPGSLVVAVRGQGTWTTSLDEPGELARLRVSEYSEANQMRILRSFESGHTNASLIDQFASYLEVQAAPVLMDSQGKYAVLAAGEGDLIVRLLSPDKLDYREKIWDQAAGSLIVEEAGGRITDLDGRELDFTAGRTLARNRGVLASNGYLHPIALQTFKELGA